MILSHHNEKETFALNMFRFPRVPVFKPRVFLFSIKELKGFLLLFNLFRLMNKKNEQVTAENFSKMHLFSISGCRVTPVCPSIYLIKMTASSLELHQPI